MTSYYENFRKRFGPDMLATLEGEDLVETMHSHANKESLVYSWLLALDILQPYCNQASTG